ncbi:MAG: hypothetical protein SGI72_18500 [Planctomycetota bacterium]|nr:hypothetical protein [Planctomycetota bacterium]
MSPQRILAASSAVLSSLVLASVVHGQTENAQPHAIDAGVSPAEMNAQKENLRDRNRGSMHPGDPLVIVGIEQGNNEIRSRTPALASAVRTPVIVDDDLAYKRKLALFEGGGRAMQPLQVTRQTHAAPRTNHSSKPVVVEETVTKEPRVLALIVGGLTSLLCCGWLFKRYGSLLGRTEG